MDSLKHLVLATALIAVASLVSERAHALYTPQAALTDALSEDLKFVGKWIPSYSESGRMPVCVYRNSKVVVYQSYCTKNRISAFGTRIHSINPKKGYVTIYAETAKDDDVTKVKRDRYADTHWYMASKTSKKFKFNGALRDFRRFDEALSKDPSPGCITSRTFPLLCKPEYAKESKSWGDPAQAFWDKPTANWYTFINVVTSKVP